MPAVLPDIDPPPSRQQFEVIRMVVDAERMARSQMLEPRTVYLSEEALAAFGGVFPEHIASLEPQLDRSLKGLAVYCRE